MTDIGERLHVVRDHLRTGRFGQRKAWEEWLTEAADEIERLQDTIRFANKVMDAKDAEIERLRTQCGGNCRYWEGRWRDEAKDNERLLAALHALQGCDIDNAAQGIIIAALVEKDTP